MNKPKILFVDIETSPIISYTWGLFDQNVSLGQIQKDWHLLSFAAKWADSDVMIYADQSQEKDISDDKKLLEKIWKLLDEADIVIGQNSKRFDIKKLNARFILNGMSPPSSYKQIDTLVLAKKYFGFTSNKLEYMTSKLNKKYKKLTHKKFPGFELWKECLAGNKAAWKEMKTYNCYDVLSLEELFNILQPWNGVSGANSYNPNHYSSSKVNKCHCGNTEFIKKGFRFTAKGKFQRFKCTKCGSETASTANLFDTKKVKSLNG